MKFVLPPNHREQTLGRCLSQIAALPKESAWSVEVKQHKPRRSLEANDKFHAMCGELAEATGYTPLEVKNLVKNELGHFEVIDTPFGKVKRFKSSTDWNKVEMGEAIETLYRYGAEVGHQFREVA